MVFSETKEFDMTSIDVIFLSFMKTRLLTNVGALMTLMNDSEVFCSYHVLITFT